MSNMPVMEFCFSSDVQCCDILSILKTRHTVCEFVWLDVCSGVALSKSGTAMSNLQPVGSRRIYVAL